MLCLSWISGLRDCGHREKIRVRQYGLRHGGVSEHEVSGFPPAAQEEATRVAPSWRSRASLAFSQVEAGPPPPSPGKGPMRDSEPLNSGQQRPLPDQRLSRPQ